MERMILVTGGARSGKSGFAEELLAMEKRVCYIATNAVSGDSEMAERIRRHRQQRPKNWQTEERFLNISEFFAEQTEDQSYLLDCVTMLNTNYYYHIMGQQFGFDYFTIDQQFEKLNQQQKNQLEQQLLREWSAISTAIRNQSGSVILVTNEIGWGVVPENNFTRWFRDLCGKVNQFLGKEADAVYLVVCGVSQKLKG